METLAFQNRGHGGGNGHIALLARCASQPKAVHRLEERVLLLLVGLAALSCWRLTPLFAQVPIESPVIEADDPGLSQADEMTDAQASRGPTDEAPQVDASGQSSAGDAGAGQSTAESSSPSPTEKKHRKFSVNPVTGLVTTSSSTYEPLTGSERVKIYFKMNYASMGAYFGPLLTALTLDQAFNSPPQWGGGFRGYGRRVASRIGGAILQGTFQAPVAAVLHEDVRYIAKGQGKIGGRMWHAVKYSFLTYNKQGRPTLNVANLGAYYASTAVSTAWLPGTRNVMGYTLSNATEQIGLSVPVNIFQEFWPEIRNFVLRRRAPKNTEPFQTR